jgi:hypothetical protein
MLPLPDECPLWLAITSRLSLEQPGLAVRLRDPVVARGRKQACNLAAIQGLLATLTETTPGMRAAAIAERLNVDLPAGSLGESQFQGTEDREAT